MKKLLCLLLVLLMLAGCAIHPAAPTDPTAGSTAPTVQIRPTDPTEGATAPVDPTLPDGATDPSEEEIPTDPAPTEGKNPTDPAPTEPLQTDPVTAPEETDPTDPVIPTETPTEPVVTEPVVTEPVQTEPTPSTGELTVHYIDVGQADCALLECNGEYMLIDGGNVADSSLVVSYLLDLGVEELEVVVGTHAHEDHMGGLAGVMAVFPVKEVYCPTRTRDAKFFNNFMKYVDQQGLEVTIPAPGDVITFGDATATVLGPVKSYADYNDTSIVLMVEYGDTRFLFTGDMEQTAERDMLDYWGEDFDWSADVLKVGHHGSGTSTGYRFLNEVMPTYGVISCGKGNSYGHPHDEALSRLRDADVVTLRTDELGTIIIRSDGKTVSVVEKSSKAR